MKIKADLHVHSHNSMDCRMTLEEIAKAAKKKGIDCVCVCDHHTTDGYYEILEKSDENGFIDGVLFLPAIEYSTDAGHIIGLFMQSPITDTHNSASLIKDLCRFSFPVLAHPYANGKGNPMIKKYIEMGVAVEVANARRSKKANRLAAENAVGLFTAGSDAHLPAEIGNTYVELDVRELTANGVFEALRHARGDVYYTPSKKVYNGISQLYKQIDAGRWQRVPVVLAKTVLFFIKDMITPRKTVVMEGKQWH